MSVDKLLPLITNELLDYFESVQAACHHVLCEGLLI